MITLYVMCGVPASGKSTLSKRLAENENLTRISFDEMRCLTQKDLISPMVTALQEGNSVIIDAVNNCIGNRKILLDSIKDVACKKIIIVMTTSLDECIERNSNREFPVPIGILKGIHHALQLPTLDEGWDEIILY